MKRTKSRNPFRIDAVSRTRLPFTRASLHTFCQKVFADLKLRQAHLSLLFVKDAEMKRWHWKLMRLRTTTDVISLGQLEGEGPNPLGSLGDLVICLDEARRQAARAGCSVQEELRRYVIHGILHCLGYDDIHPRDHKKMWGVQEQLVKKYRKFLG